MPANGSRQSPKSLVKHHQLTPILTPALAASDDQGRTSAWSIAAVIGRSQTSANEDEPQEPTL